MDARSYERVRPAAVAGRFYPGDPAALRQVVEGMIAAATPIAGLRFKALIAPHAGYPFSGPVAASAYASWKPERGVIRRVVLLGPSHRTAFKGIATASYGAFATPLGLVRVDRETVAGIHGLPGVQMRDEAHELEHALEVQLPFLQALLDEFSIVPLLTGDIRPESLGEILDRLWGGDESRIVVSSDLSHYLDSWTAEATDRLTAEAIVALDPERIGHDRACGRTAVLGLLHTAQRRGIQVRTLDLRNSGDMAGPRDRVVGYGAFGFSEPVPEGSVTPGMKPKE
jgi:MEMO1 family protein